MEDMELICFELISHHGSARSYFIEAIGAAKAGDFSEAEAKMAAGEEEFLAGHRVHAQLVQREAGGEAIPVSLLLVHAADIMTSAETLKIIARELIDLYKK